MGMTDDLEVAVEEGATRGPRVGHGAVRHRAALTGRVRTVRASADVLTS